MKSITINQFIDIIKNATITTRSEKVETIPAQYDDSTDMTWGWIWNDLTADGLKIIYQNSYEHIKDKPSSATKCRDIDEPWIVDTQEFSVIDDDCEELDVDEIIALVSEHTYIECLNLKILGNDATENIDLEKEIEMETIIVHRDNDRDIKFLGEKIASVASSPNNSRSDYSGSVGRWTELSIYRTASGKFICEQIGRTQWQGEKTRYSGAIFDNHEQVVDFFGLGWLAKELYEKAGINAVIDVE